MIQSNSAVPGAASARPAEDAARMSEGLAPGLLRAIRIIDGFTAWTGKTIAWLMLPLVFGVTWEVVARYGFNAPTIWAFDMTYMLYGTMFMLGTAYALLKGAHIRTDIFWERLSDRQKGRIDTLAYLLFFFPGLLMILLTSWDEAFHSFLLGERSEQTAWQPILWPFKAVIPLTALLLLVQGVSEFLKSLYGWRTGRAFQHRETILV